MPRFINPNPQFSDKNGSPLAFGSITFYESGTTTFKTTYSDPGLTVPNDNPVPLDAAGRAQTDIFYEGDASVILKDSNDVVQWQDDPVSSGNSSSFPEWNAGTTYQIDDIVKYEGDFYRAIASSTNEVPTNQEFWSKILQTEEWNPNDTYNIDALVVRNGIHYISLIDDNTSDPETTSNEWRSSSSATVIYEDTGSSSNYTIKAKSNFSNQEREDGLVLQFIAKNTNTAAATLNYNDSGDSNIVDSNGSNIANAAIESGDLVKVVYQSSSDTFRLESGVSSIRVSKINDPLVSIFKKNKSVETLRGSLSSTRSTTATFADRYGIIQTAAINELREDVNGWLIEPSSTNLATYSEQFDNGSWQKNDAIVTPNDTTAPDGTITADRVDYQAVATTSYVRKFIAATPGDDFACSIYIKGTEGEVIRIAGSGTNTDHVLSGDWDLVSIQFNASGNYNFSIIGNNTAQTIWIWGAQVEQRATRTSYIPTVASTVTRSSDNVSIDFNGNAPDLTKPHTIICKIANSDQPIEDFAKVLSSNTATNFNIQFSSSGSNLTYKLGSGSTYTVAVALTDVPESIAITFDESSVTGYIDGKQRLTQSFNGTFAVNTDTTIYLGSQDGSTAFTNATFNEFTFYDFALTPKEISYLLGGS